MAANPIRESNILYHEHRRMNYFETHQQAERIFLKFDQPALASMIQKKNNRFTGL